MDYANPPNRNMQGIKPHIAAITKSYSEVIFLNNPFFGILILLATLINPSVAAAGLLSVVAAYLFAAAINMDRDFLKSGIYTFNPLLVGLGIGFLFKMTALTVFIIIAAGILTLIFTIIFSSSRDSVLGFAPLICAFNEKS